MRPRENTGEVEVTPPDARPRHGAPRAAERRAPPHPETAFSRPPARRVPKLQRHRRREPANPRAFCLPVPRPMEFAAASNERSARRFPPPGKGSYGQTVMKENDIGGRENICTKSCRRDGSGSRGWGVDEAYSIRAGRLPRRRTNASSVDTPDSRDDLESRRSRHETRRFAPRRSLDDARDQITGPLVTREDEP